MDELVKALTPIFAAGFATQQFLEILTNILDLDQRPNFQKYKKAILGLVSLVVGFVLASLSKSFQIFPALKADDSVPIYLSIPISALVLSAGTDGLNSIVKFMKYAKEEKKATAAEKLTALETNPEGQTARKRINAV